MFQTTNQIVKYMPPIANYRFEPAIDRSYVHQLRSSHFSVAVRRRTLRLDGLLELCGVTRVNVLAMGRWRGAWRGAFSPKAETKNRWCVWTLYLYGQRLWFNGNVSVEIMGISHDVRIHGNFPWSQNLNSWCGCVWLNMSSSFRQMQIQWDISTIYKYPGKPAEEVSQK